MRGSNIEQAISSIREEKTPESCPIQQILENGERIGHGNWKDVFYSEQNSFTDSPELEDTEVVVKVFSSNKIEGIRKRIDRAHSKYFPDTVPAVCDTTTVENPEVLVKEENAAIVIQEKSDESILHNTSYKNALKDVTRFVDDLVETGQIMDDFKAEAIHIYDQDLKYVDFEDKEAVKTWPLHEEASTSTDVSYEMALMYANLAVGLAREYHQELGAVKDNIAFNSEIINDDVYNEKGFVPEMIDGWHYQ